MDRVSTQTGRSHGTEPPRSKLPKYLIRRAGHYYFKRKIPLDVRHGFANQSGQVWKSLGTSYFEKAKVMLAVEIVEFELQVNKLRREAARSHPAIDESYRSAVTAAADEQEKPLTRARQQLNDTGSRPETNGSALQVKQMGVATQARSNGVGKLESSPKAARQMGSKGGLTLRHLYEHWKVGQTRRRTMQSVEKAVNEFHELHGQLRVDDITRQHARDYRDVLIEQSLSAGTIENRIGFLSTLFRFGQQELIEHLIGNPFERIIVLTNKNKRVVKDRRAYTVKELNKLYESPLYTKGTLPRGQAEDAAYWLPILGPFVGGRIEELCQLRIDDIERINGHWCIRICNLDEEQNLKNIGSYRRVPLHKNIIACGFLAYVAEQAKEGHERVFPSLKNDNANGTWSNAAGKWFGRWLDSMGMSDPRLDYHSFRYTFRQQCTLCGIENETRDALTGHWISNKDAGRAYMKAEERQYPFPKLVTAIGELNYDGLKMAHLFVQEPMKDVEAILLEGVTSAR